MGGRFPVRGECAFAGALLLLLAGAQPAAGQDAVALRGAMLYDGMVQDVEQAQPAIWVPQAAPLRGVLTIERAQGERRSLQVDTTLADSWLGRDKALHAAGSFLLTLSAQYVLTAKLDTDEGTAVPLAAGVTLSLGLAKEVADSRRPVGPLFSTRDLVADAVGVVLAVGLILL